MSSINNFVCVWCGYLQHQQIQVWFLQRWTAVWIWVHGAGSGSHAAHVHGHSTETVPPTPSPLPWPACWGATPLRSLEPWGVVECQPHHTTYPRVQSRQHRLQTTPQKYKDGLHYHHDQQLLLVQCRAKGFSKHRSLPLWCSCTLFCSKIF